MTSKFDVAGRRTQLTWRDGVYVTYDYDAAGQMTPVRENGSFTLATYGYDDLGNRTSMSSGNGVTTSYAYDPLSRLQRLKLDLTGTGFEVTTTFDYNPASQIDSKTRGTRYTISRTRLLSAGPTAPMGYANIPEPAMRRSAMTPAAT